MLVVRLLALFSKYIHSESSKMESSKLLRSRRSSDNRKKRKKKEKAANTKRRRSRNARIAEAESSKIQLEKTDQKSPKQHANSHGDVLEHTEHDEPKENNSLDEDAKRYHRHAIFFYSKWKEAEEGNLPVIEETSLKELQTEIGRGCFGVCSLARYGARIVVVKQQDDNVTSKQEARMVAKLSHPNLACLIGIIERKSRIDIVTNFYSLNGTPTNLSNIPTENASDINWRHLIKGLCDGIRYLHNKAKLLHNDIKSNNVVLDGGSLSEAEAVLVDFGKASKQISPKIYQTPADTRKFKHLAPELGIANGKQSRKSDIYSFGYLIRGLNYKFPDFPSIFVNLYRSCLRSSPSRRPSASDLYEQLEFIE